MLVIVAWIMTAPLFAGVGIVLPLKYKKYTSWVMSDSILKYYVKLCKVRPKTSSEISDLLIYCKLIFFY